MVAGNSADMASAPYGGTMLLITRQMNSSPGSVWVNRHGIDAGVKQVDE